ncbi:MAG: trehalose 6-phosphate phosphatase [Actinomycetota bacterium]|nr:trehalose 6-phosphate phosphatase [Actinomycetota bacterium]
MEGNETQVEQIRARLMSGTRVGVLLDVDGTLSPIVARSDDARLQAGARASIEAVLPHLALVAVVSGRPTPEAAALVGIEGVTVLGSYGLGDLPDVPADVLAEVEAISKEIPGTRVERKGGTVAVHVREAPDPDAAEVSVARALVPIAERAHMDIAPGKRVLELVPAGHDLKGEAVERTIADATLDAVMYVGDDLADLGAFAALDRAAATGVTTVKVAVRGPETPEELVSDADFVVEGPEGVVGLLRGLVV